MVLFLLFLIFNYFWGVEREVFRSLFHGYAFLRLSRKSREKGEWYLDFFFVFLKWESG